MGPASWVSRRLQIVTSLAVSRSCQASITASVYFFFRTKFSLDICDSCVTNGQPFTILPLYCLRDWSSRWLTLYSYYCMCEESVSLVLLTHMNFLNMLGSMACHSGLQVVPAATFGDVTIQYFYQVFKSVCLFVCLNNQHRICSCCETICITTIKIFPCLRDQR